MPINFAAPFMYRKLSKVRLIYRWQCPIYLEIISQKRADRHYYLALRYLEFGYGFRGYELGLRFPPAILLSRT